MKTNFIKILVVGFIVAWINLLSGCHTVQGIGEDVETGGRAIERAGTTR